MDAADEAGGETIFSSDGMDPLPVPKVPVVASAFSNESTENVYELLETDTPLLDPSLGNSAGESPQERLKRLVREAESLKREMKDNDQVAKLANELTTRLQSSSTVASAHDDLVRSIQQRVDQTKESTPQASGIVYELYGGGTTTTTAVPSSVEERLLRLEGSVGASSSSLSILERIERVENMANRVDEKALDDAATRAKVIRADLEAASKARTKLSGAAVSANDSKKISELHDQLKQLEGIGMHLPALSLRLRQLATLHSQGATFANRLSGVEQDLPKIQASLQELQQSLSQVEEGMLSNIKTVQENMQVLESKMTK